MTIAMLLAIMQDAAEKPQVPMNVMGFVLIAAGAFGAYGAYKDWEWVVQGGRGGGLILKLLGRKGTRIFQGTLGIIFFCIGLMMVAMHYSGGAS